MSKTSRRAVLAAAYLTVVSPPADLAAAGEASSDDPLVAMCARWWALHRAINPPDPQTAGADEETEPLCEELNELQNKISETPAISREGALAKVRIAEWEMAEGSPGELDIVERLFVSVFADARRLLA